MASFQGVYVGQFPFQHFWLREELSSPQEELPPLEPPEVVEELPKVGLIETRGCRRCKNTSLVVAEIWLSGRRAFLFVWLNDVDR